jgi:hypothetical protein
MNLLGPELVADLVSVIQRAEGDDAVQVLVFTSADPDYFISQVDVPRISEYRESAAKLTGEPSLALLFHHLSASDLVTIAQIEGRARGADSEFVLACDMRFGARESAIFGQSEPAFGLIPGGGAMQHLARLMGRVRRSRSRLARTITTLIWPSATAGQSSPAGPRAPWLRQLARPANRPFPRRRSRRCQGPRQRDSAGAGRRVSPRLGSLPRGRADA